jgi:hypothetical protein
LLPRESAGAAALCRRSPKNASPPESQFAGKCGDMIPRPDALRTIAYVCGNARGRKQKKRVADSFPKLKSGDEFETISRVGCLPWQPAVEGFHIARTLQHLVPDFFRAVVAILFLANEPARRLAA